MQMPAEEKNSVRRDGFVLARLPQLEMYFYYAIWIAHSFGALLLVYKITYDLQRSMQAWLPRSDYVPSYHIDTSDPEWSFYRMALPQMLFANFAHIGKFFNDCVVVVVKFPLVSYQTNAVQWKENL
uniref:MBOAT family protein n=1 Tax=Ascaris lumbricoides TaxID=6252 RepID=A0A0M3HRG0_ASCLU